MRKKIFLILILISNLLCYTKELERKKIMINKSEVEMIKLKEERETKIKPIELYSKDYKTEDIKAEEGMFYGVSSVFWRMLNELSLKLYPSLSFKTLKINETGFIFKDYKYKETGLLSSYSWEVSYSIYNLMLGIGERKAFAYYSYYKENSGKIELKKPKLSSYSSDYILLGLWYELDEYKSGFFLKIYDEGERKPIEIGMRSEGRPFLIEHYLGFISNKVEYKQGENTEVSDCSEWYWGINIGWKIW